MQFELTEALIDDILFSMEDQDGEFCLDTVEGVVAGGADGPEIDWDEGLNSDGGPRYIELPEWDSASGFRLMERFVAGFRNPLVREELTAALNHGKGVFRAFKNTLGRYPEAEKHWFLFKEREMKREVIRWYNGLREEWGLKKIGMEPEDTGDLVLEDFRFRPFTADDIPLAEELHRSCLEEYKKAFAESGAINSSGVLLKEFQIYFSSMDNLFSAEQNAHAPAMAAESGGGDFAGYISGTIRDSVLYIQALEVKAEYRGMGIGEALLIGFIDGLDANEVTHVLLDMPSWAEHKSPLMDGFSRVLLRESFRPYVTRYSLNMRERGD